MPKFRPLFALVATIALIVGLSLQASAQDIGTVKVGKSVAFRFEHGIGKMDAHERAQLINHRIERLLHSQHIKPDHLRVEDRSGVVTIALPPFEITTVTSADAEGTGKSVAVLAEHWNQELREAFVKYQPAEVESKSRELSFLPLLLVTAITFLVPIIFSRIRVVAIPVIVGEIIAGIIIGRSGFDLIGSSSWLHFLAEFGFAYLMFLVGLEVDVGAIGLSSLHKRDVQIKNQEKVENPLILATMVMAITFLMAMLCSFGLYFAGVINLPWFMSIVLSTTSLGLVVPVLKERGYLNSPYGQTMLVTALLADLITMFLITIVAGWLSSGPTWQLFVGLSVVCVFIFLLRYAHLLSDLKILHRYFDEISSATSQVKVRGALALMLIFAVLSESLGSEVILGAFLAGVVLALFTKDTLSTLHSTLEALGFGFFIPIFFIMVGARFDLSSLVESREAMLLAPMLILAAFAIKITAALPFRKITSWRQTLASGLLLSSRLSLIIAAAEIGLRLHIFNETMHSALICVALVTGLLGPLGFQLVLPRAKGGLRSRILIVGGEQHGLLLAERLIKQDRNVSLLTLKPSARHKALVPEEYLIAGDGANVEDLKKAGIENARAVVAVGATDIFNEQVCRLAEDFGVQQRVAILQDDVLAQKLRESGVVAITPITGTQTVLEAVLTYPAMYRLLSGQDREKRIAEGILVNQRLVGRKLKRVNWSGDVLVLSIQRNLEVMIPDGETVLEFGDSLVLIGSEQPVADALALLN